MPYTEEDLSAGRFTPAGNAAEAARVAAAAPARMKIAGADTSRMTTPEVANQMQYMMQPDWAKRRQQKNAYRGMNDLQRRQAIEDYVMRRNAFAGTDAGAVMPENRISLLTPTGPTADERMPLDYRELSPQARAVYDTGIQNFNKDFSGLMSSSDTSAWRNEHDFDQAVSNLQSVRDFGHLIEGHAYAIARKKLPQSLRIKFEANDRNAESFSRWFKDQQDTNPAFLSPAGYGDPMDIWADNESPAAQRLKATFMRDANAEKWIEKNGKLEQMKLTPEQIRGQQLEAQRQSDEITGERQVNLAKEVYDQLPDEQKEQFVIGPKGQFIRLPQRSMSVDEQKAELRANGLDDDYISKNYELKPTAKGSILVHKKVDATRLKREGRAEQYVATGVPIAAMPDGSPDTETALSNVDVWQGDKLVSGAMLGITPKAQRDANIASGKWQYKLKEGLKPWTPAPDTAEQAAPQSPSQPSSQQQSAQPKQVKPVPQGQTRDTMRAAIKNASKGASDAEIDAYLKSTYGI